MYKPSLGIVLFLLFQQSAALELNQASEAELRAWVRSRLAAFKVPVEVRFWPETLPRNANGKILKTELKKVFEARG